MQINLILNGTKVSADVAADTLLLDLVRSQGCASVKRGCETSNCGLCTVFLEDKPVLSCSVLAVRADGKRVTTLEGLQEEAAEFGAFIADQGAEQCGFCNPGSSTIKISLMKQVQLFLLHGQNFRMQQRRSKINSAMTFIHGVLI